MLSSLDKIDGHVRLESFELLYNEAIQYDLTSIL